MKLLSSNSMKKAAMLFTLAMVVLFGSGFTYAKDTSIEFRGDSHKLVTTEDNFFSDLNQMLPGDTLDGKATIKNAGGRRTEIFFTTEPENINEDDAIEKEALERITMKISIGDKVIFDGPLSKSCENVSLGKYGDGDSAQLSFELQVPADMTNEFNMQELGVKWVFSAEEEPEIIKTGDDTNYEYYLIGLGLATVGITYIFLEKKDKESHKD